MRVSIVSMTTFTSPGYRRVLSAIARRVDSLAVVTGDIPSWRAAAPEPLGEPRPYALHTVTPRFDRSWATVIFPGLRELILDARPEVVHIIAEPWQLLAYQSLRAAGRTRAAAGIQFAENGPRLMGPGGHVRRAAAKAALRQCAYAVGMTSQSSAVARELARGIDIATIPPPSGISAGGSLQDSGDIETWFGEGAKERFRIAFVGSFARHKGVTDLIGACDALETAIPISVAVAGPGGPLHSLLEDWTATKGHRLHGLLDRAGVLALLRASDVLMMPSRTVQGGAEQFGRVAVEAMSQGLPVVGYDCGGLHEVLGDAGFIVPEGDREALESVVRRIASLPDQDRRELRERAHRRASDFTDDAIAEGLTRLWRVVCSGR